MTDQAELYRNDPSIRQGEDGYWYHYPNYYRSKLTLVLVSLVILAVGLFLIKDPLGRLLFGETAQARVTEVIRKEPGEEAERIRYRKKIDEGSHLTTFFYQLAVDQPDGTQKSLELAVASVRVPVLNVNDTPTIIYYRDGNYAFELYEQRTWAFGVGFMFVGLIMFICTVPLFLAVGKPIRIDPEARDSPADKATP